MSALCHIRPSWSAGAHNVVQVALPNASRHPPAGTCARKDYHRLPERELSSLIDFHICTHESRMKKFAHRLAQIHGQISLHAEGFYPILIYAPQDTTELWSYGRGGIFSLLLLLARVQISGTFPVLYARHFLHRCVYGSSRPFTSPAHQCYRDSYTSEYRCKHREAFCIRSSCLLADIQ